MKSQIYACQNGYQEKNIPSDKCLRFFRIHKLARAGQHGFAWKSLWNFVEMSFWHIWQIAGDNLARMSQDEIMKSGNYGLLTPKILIFHARNIWSVHSYLINDFLKSCLSFNLSGNFWNNFMKLICLEKQYKIHENDWQTWNRNSHN